MPLALRALRMAAAALAVSGCATGGPAGTPSEPLLTPPSASATTAATRAAPSSPAGPPALAGPAQVIDMLEPVWGIAAAGDALWVEGNGRLRHLDGATGAELGQLTGLWPTVTGDSLWYLRDDEVVEADAATGDERATYTPPVRGTTVADGFLWSASEETGILTAVNLETNKVRFEVELPAGEPKWIQSWEDALWVLLDGSGGIVVRIDPTTGTIIDDLDAGYRPHSATVAFGSFWVTDHGRAKLLRYAPDGSIQAEIPGPGMNVAIAASPDAVWAASPQGVMKIDPATNAVVGEVVLGSGEWYAMAFSHDSIWLTSADGQRLYQIDAGS
jgi:hypothetical protein